VKKTIAEVPSSRSGESRNVAAVRRLYEARGNAEIVRQVLAPDVRWEVVPGFPHSDVYRGLNGVFDFFTRLFGDFEDWHTEPSEFFESGDRVIAIGTYSARAKATGKTFKARFAHVWTMCAMASSRASNKSPIRCRSREHSNLNQ
jgi:uncharacterized protein